MTTKSHAIERPSVVLTRSTAMPAFERLDSGFGHQLDAVAPVHVAVERAELLAEDALQRHGRRFDDGHVETALTRRGGKLGPDPAGSDHGHLRAGLEARSQRVAVGERTQVVHSVEAGAGHPDLARLRAGGDQQPVVGGPRIAVDEDPVLGRVDRRDPGRGQQLDVVLLVEALLVHAGLLPRHLAAQVFLGQRRPLVGELVLVSDQHDRAVKALGAQLLGRFRAGQAGTDDHEGLIAHRVLLPVWLARVGITIPPARAFSIVAGPPGRRPGAARARVRLPRRMPCPRGQSTNGISIFVAAR